LVLWQLGHKEFNRIRGVPGNFPLSQHTQKYTSFRIHQ